MSKRVAVITGGMGGLGETISTKMADADYRVVVTYSPSNKTSDKWLAAMQQKG
jgi:acetoacetyl-CoA reductase